MLSLPCAQHPIVARNQQCRDGLDMSNERESSEDNFELDPSDAAQRRTLLKVLFINLAVDADRKLTSF